MKDTSSPEPSATRAPSVSSAVWPCACDLDVDAVVVEPVLELGELGVGVVDDARDVVAERGGLVADRVGEHRREPADDHDEREEHGQHGEPARERARALQQRDERVQQQRESAATTKISVTGPAARSSA